MEILNLVLKTLYLLLPVYLANMFAVLSSRWSFLSSLNKPIDSGKNFGQRRLLGDGKTWRGLVVGFMIGTIIVIIQICLYSFESFRNISLINYAAVNWLWLSLISGLGPLLGDLIASFFKRRLNFERGAPLPFVDQWDFITSYFLLLALVSNLDWNIVIAGYLLTLIIHPLSNIIAYFLKIKKVWW
ncbi:MAG TPA: CDP-2,3-bis-(O-geranylgeranyl)-sn-glycerol synthase [Patescibacteria group bacterium]|nr:CDP-2,3-bis-(O-geranylgeranyl)-sn-glycerol synthase [Patescibacteria group bacterium]